MGIKDLKFLRKKRNWTLRYVEQQTGLSNAYLSQLENGKIKNPSFNTIEKLATLFDNNPIISEKCKCPNCKSENVQDASTYKNNGVFGPGSASWKTFDAMVCNECGIFFKQVEGNGTKNEKTPKKYLLDEDFIPTLPNI